VSATSPSWALHPQLEADTVLVGELALSRLLLANDANYPWLILVPRCEGVSEIIDLDEAGQAELTREIALVCRALKAVTPCDKLNVAALGNMVPQLHVHIIARRHGDPAWPKPIWGVVTAREYDAAARDRLIAALRGALRQT
jgi:diadenosine tetraphosphate (Ap4A) HIT family hydrolase